MVPMKAGLWTWFSNHDCRFGEPGGSLQLAGWQKFQAAFVQLPSGYYNMIKAKISLPHLNGNHLFACASLCFLFSMTSMAGNVSALGLIPLPQSVQQNEGVYRIQPDVRIFTDADTRDSGEYLAARLHAVTGYPVNIETYSPGDTNRGGIFLTANSPKTGLGVEGYELTVNPDGIIIQAPDAAGAFYGVQTLLQLLPPEIFGTGRVDGVAWTVPAVQIEDQPRFKWRGFMLDVSRHFYNKEEIEQTLDFMAMHKLNVFHWHLVDDHGWRIEIKKYPRLTQIGAWRNSIGFELATNESTAYGPDGRYGGFYTPDDIREVVKYAAARHIAVVPEIEMPGHSTAALAAYPELSCTGGPFSMDLNAGIYNGIFDPAKEETFQFLDDVLTEVFRLFPGKYIHLGGDEVPKDTWKNSPDCQALMKREGLKDEEQLQGWFMQRMEKFVLAHGRIPIGWTEILQGGLATNTAVMDWKGGGPDAAESGHDVVMASQEYYYLCYYQSLDRPPNLKAARPYLPLEKVYDFNPIPEGLKPEADSHILGVEACVWTVFFASMRDMEEMSFPRLCAVAETAWSPDSSRNFEDFTNRLATHESRLDQAGIAYWNHHDVKIGEWQPSQLGSTTNVLEWELPLDSLSPGKYRLSLDYLHGRNGLKIDWAALLEDGREISRDTHEGLAGAGYNRAVKALDWNYFLNLPVVKTGARYAIRVSVSGAGGNDSRGDVFLDPSSSD